MRAPTAGAQPVPDGVEPGAQVAQEAPLLHRREAPPERAELGAQGVQHRPRDPPGRRPRGTAAPAGAAATDAARARAAAASGMGASCRQEPAAGEEMDAPPMPARIEREHHVHRGQTPRRAGAPRRPGPASRAAVAQGERQASRGGSAVQPGGSSGGKLPSASTAARAWSGAPPASSAEAQGRRARARSHPVDHPATRSPAASSSSPRYAPYSRRCEERLRVGRSPRAASQASRCAGWSGKRAHPAGRDVEEMDRLLGGVGHAAGERAAGVDEGERPEPRDAGERQRGERAARASTDDDHAVRHALDVARGAVLPSGSVAPHGGRSSCPCARSRCSWGACRRPA